MVYPPKDLYGTSLFPLGIGQVLRWARRSPHVGVLAAFPRYYPSWAAWLADLPDAREVLTWNLALVLERREGDRCAR